MDEKLNNILSTLLGLNENQIADELSMENVEAWDSLMNMELIVSIEKTFQIELTFDEISLMNNVGAIKEILTKRSNGN